MKIKEILIALVIISAAGLSLTGQETDLCPKTVTICEVSGGCSNTTHACCPAPCDACSETGTERVCTEVRESPPPPKPPGKCTDIRKEDITTRACGRFWVAPCTGCNSDGTYNIIFTVCHADEKAFAYDNDTHCKLNDCKYK